MDPYIVILTETIRITNSYGIVGYPKSKAKPRMTADNNHCSKLYTKHMPNISDLWFVLRYKIECMYLLHTCIWLQLLGSKLICILGVVYEMSNGLSHLEISSDQNILVGKIYIPHFKALNKLRNLMSTQKSDLRYLMWRPQNLKFHQFIKTKP